MPEKLGVTLLLSFVALVVAIIWSALLRATERANVADWGGRWVNRLDGLNRLFCSRYHRLRTPPLPLPESGSAIVISNHLSGLDAMVLIAASPRPLHFLIATEEYHRFGLRWLFRAARCIPVDRDGHPERAFREALRVLARGEVVALFPYGAIHLDGDKPKPIKSGAVRLAQLAGAPIIPVRIDGVRIPGHIFPAVILRGHVALRYSESVWCTGLDPGECRQRLAHMIASSPSVD